MPTQAKPSRFWKLAQQEKNKCGSRRIPKKIKKAIQTKTGINSSFIQSILNCSPSFIGCYAENELKKLTITSFPSYLIVNIDSNDLNGSHWIALGIFNETIEIFDPLGFDIFNWSNIPCHLLDFLHRLSVTRHVHTAPKIQSGGHLCGFYAIFYVIVRQLIPFDCLSNYFCARNNDKILYKFFKND